MSGAKYFQLERPIIIGFARSSALEQFRSSSIRQTGFYVSLVSRDNDQLKFHLYTSGYRFNAYVFSTSNRTRQIGFYISEDGKPMRQHETLHALTSCCQVFGLEEKYIIICNDWDVINALHRTDWDRLVQTLSEEPAVQAPRTGDIAADMEQKRALRNAAYMFHQVQPRLLEADRQFRQEHFFRLEYNKVESVLQSHNEGTIFRFQLSRRTPDKVAKKLKVGAVLNIPLEQLRPLRGSVTEFHPVNNTLELRFRGTDLAQIPETGLLVESENISYRHVAAALSGIRGHLAQNDFLEPLLFGGSFPAIPQNQRFQDPSFNEHQRSAVEKAINTRDFLLVQGPPGTGKTQIIIEMVKRFVAQGQRVLICSQSNHAVDNVLQKCLSLHFDAPGNPPIHCLRIGEIKNIEPVLHNNMLRPLTETIQHDMRQRSAEAFQKYAKIRNAISVTVNQFIRMSQEAFALLTEFKFLHSFYRGLFPAFGNSFLEKLFVPKFLKQIRGQLQICLELATEGINLLVTQLNGQPDPDISSRLQQLLESLVAHTRQLITVVGKSGFWRKRFMDKTVLSRLETSLKNQEAALPGLLEKTQLLADCKGNPAAGLLPTLPTATTAEEYHFNSREYSQTLQTAADRLRADTVQTGEDLQLWAKVLKNDNKSIGEALLSSIKIIGATCIGSSTNPRFNELTYDVAIVDEAGQIPLHNLLVPLVKAKKVILVGDHIQLPPLEDSDLTDHLKNTVVKELTEQLQTDETENIFFPFDSLAEVYNKSLFEILYRRAEAGLLADHAVMLTKQYRCHPAIADFVSKHFYGGGYESGISPEDRQLQVADFREPMYFFSTNGMAKSREAQIPGSDSYLNPAEAKICAIQACKILMAIRSEPEKYRHLIDKHGNYDIGIISGYGAQIQLIATLLRQLLTSAIGTSAEAQAEVAAIMSKVSINSLDSFQGMEKQIILFSFVRSNEKSKIGFLHDTRRLNVLMTRAKSLLILVGNQRTLCTTTAVAVHDKKPVAPLFSALIQACRCVGNIDKTLFSQEVESNG